MPTCSQSLVSPVKFGEGRSKFAVGESPPSDCFTVDCNRREVFQTHPQAALSPAPPAWGRSGLDGEREKNVVAVLDIDVV